MNYKVLYRKYRPTDFENIIGQEYIIKTLKNSIINNNISHAYIFSGPRGTGKTSTAKVFSKAINCDSHNDGSPCGKCNFCLNFTENPDIIEIDAASNNGVDEIRGLIDNIKLTPTNGKYKVYIIDEVHMLTTSAFNALLLTLEEPPSHAVFILATTNIENVPITILSRCQRFDFQKITVNNLVEGLKNVCDRENIVADEEALTEIAYLSEGGMRDALSLLDQLSKNKQHITLELVEKQIKIISQKGVMELLESIEENDIEVFLNLVDDYKVRAIDHKTLIKKIIDVASLTAKNIKKTGRIQRLSFEDYKNLVMCLSECLTKININVNPYTILEMELLGFFSLNTSVSRSIDEANVEIEVPVSRQTQTSVRNKFADANVINVRINNCFVNAKRDYLEKAKNMINNCKIAVEGKIKGILIDSNVVAASDKYMILTCINDHAAGTANKMLIDIEMELKKSANEDYKLIFISDDRWKKEKNEYISNLKNNKKYELIEENASEEISTEPIISDVFDISKVEVI